MSAVAAEYPPDLTRKTYRSQDAGFGRPWFAFAGWHVYATPIGPAAESRVFSGWCTTEEEALRELEIRIVEALG